MHARHAARAAHAPSALHAPRHDRLHRVPSMRHWPELRQRNQQTQVLGSATPQWLLPLFAGTVAADADADADADAADDAAGEDLGGAATVIVKRVRLTVMTMCPQPSQFVAWQYLKHNELARDHGKRLFYTDETGETVPASDDEGDEVRG